MRPRTLLPYLTISLLCVALAFAAGYFSHAHVSGARAGVPLLLQARQILEDNAYDDLPPASELEYGMIRGMLQTYGDPHTVFLEPVQHELASDSLHGSFGGIGVRLVRDPEGATLLYPLPDSPAGRAGVEDGDRLVRVDSLEITADTPTDQLQAAIRGPLGSAVAIGVRRGGEADLRTFSIRRQEIQLPSVTWRQTLSEPRVGVIEVNLLAASTPDEMLAAVEALRVGGATHFLLDLRDNNGGLLTAGVDAARLFLESGTILQQQYRGRSVETFAAERPGRLTEVPLAVLINHNTASAAEILAGALQANGRAPLIGTPSFGKDSVQLVFDLDDGSSLHVTAARWWIPGLQPPLRDHGLQPDIPLGPDEANSEAAVRAGIEVVLASQ